MLSTDGITESTVRNEGRGLVMLGERVGKLGSVCKWLRAYQLQGGESCPQAGRKVLK